MPDPRQEGTHAPTPVTSARREPEMRVSLASTKAFWTLYFFLARGDGEFEVRCRHGASQSHRFASEQSLLPAASGRIEVDV
jgi:hypothetical protein